jgi:hypothetical protein
MDKSGATMMNKLDRLDALFVIWAFFLQVILIIHFAIRKPLFEIYTLKYGWLVYALCIPAVIISLILLRGGKSWSFWLGGFLFLIFAAYGYWVDYHLGINWRVPLRKDIMFPYVTLYLSTIMFYWWPLGILNKPLWYVFAILFVIGTVLNITSH